MSRNEKNVLDPDVRNAIRNFAVLDGAFVIREDGVVLAAGRYLKFDEAQEFKVPLGLGARHVAAAGISQDTEGIAIVVSETTGEVRLFQKGRCMLHINPQQRVRRVIVGGDTDSQTKSEGVMQGGPLPGKDSAAKDAKDPKEPREGRSKG